MTTTKLLAKIRGNDSLPLHADIENHPPARLPSRHPLWLGVPREEESALDEWCDEWLDTDVINQSLVDDPTAVPPGFSLPRHLLAKLNHFRTGQGQCAANLARWRKIPDPSCTCGAAKQTMSHIVNDSTALDQDFLAVLLLYISLVMRQSSGWACSANDNKKISKMTTEILHTDTCMACFINECKTRKPS